MIALPFRTIAAWAVHAYTATGALLAFLALLAVIEHDARSTFLWLFAATIVDATDGWMARRVDVKRYAPTVDGARLDDIVDYLTFVFLPAFFVYHFQMLPIGWGVVAIAAVLLSSAFGFTAIDAKTPDYFFTGFPSYWNIAALYLFALHVPPVANAAILIALAALVFVRIGYIYPTRTPQWRAVTILLCIVWGAMVLAIAWMLPDPPEPLVISSLFFPVYYLVLSLVLQRRRRLA